MNIITNPPAECVALLSKAKALLVLNSPFFASVLLRKQIRWSDSVPTAGVNAKGEVFLNPGWIKENVPTASHMVFLLAHECMHYMLQHMTRRGQRKAMPWNVAGDKVINETLIAAGVGTFIDGGQRHPGAEGMTAEALYNADEDDGGKGGDKRGGGDPGNDLIESNLTDGESAEIEANVKIDITQARQAAKMAGKMPEALARMVDAIVEVRTPWHQILERYMVSFCRADLSWSRPNRRHVANNLYLPGTNYMPEMGPVVIGVDTSGSIDDVTLAHFGGHVNRIMELCRPSAIHIVYCDARVNHTDTLTCEDLPVKLTAHGGGGTDLRHIFDWTDKLDTLPDVLVVLTDMYTPFPDEAPAYPTVWVSTTDGASAPFGDVVQYRLEDL